MSAGGTRPTPERLAAYADGELHGPERALVEAWLDVCPQARAEVEALRRLASQCRHTVAPEPSPDAWDAALNRLHAALPAEEPRPLPYPRPRRRSFRPALGAAAAVVAAVLVGRGLWLIAPRVPPSVASPANPTVAVTPFSPSTLTGPLRLVDAHDVDIISMDGEDTGILLVGHPPLLDALVLAGPGDVTLVGMEPADGPAPDLRRNRDALLVVPPSAADAP
jgi:anti-sigma factor RsiW